MTYRTKSIFEFDWEEARGLDLKLVDWESRCGNLEDSLTVLELSQALYSAFIEIRKIRRIMSDWQPGVAHSFYQYRFELFAHNHFLSIAATRVVKIFQLGWPSVAPHTLALYAPLIERVTSYRNNLEHQTDIRRKKPPPNFFNNLDSDGYVSDGISVAYSEIENLLNDVMLALESMAGRDGA